MHNSWISSTLIPDDAQISTFPIRKIQWSDLLLGLFFVPIPISYTHLPRYVWRSTSARIEIHSFLSAHLVPEVLSPGQKHPCSMGLLGNEGHGYRVAHNVQYRRCFLHVSEELGQLFSRSIGLHMIMHTDAFISRAHSVGQPQKALHI